MQSFHQHLIFLLTQSHHMMSLPSRYYCSGAHQVMMVVWVFPTTQQLYKHLICYTPMLNMGIPCISYSRTTVCILPRFLLQNCMGNSPPVYVDNLSAGKEIMLLWYCYCNSDILVLFSKLWCTRL